MNNWVKTIFRHETPQGGAWYSVAVSGKDQEGAKKYEYWPVDFPQGTDIADRAKVEFKDFYISFYTRRDGATQYKFVVQDFLLQGGSAVYPQNGRPQAYQQPARGYGQQPQGQQTQGWGNGWQQQPQQYQQPAVNYGPNNRPPQTQNRPPQPDDFEQLDEEVPF